jgi:hypothetical protein
MPHVDDFFTARPHARRNDGLNTDDGQWANRGSFGVKPKGAGELKMVHF